MRAVIVSFALAALALVAGCSIDARTDDLRCENMGQCPVGRVCTGGWCVVDPDKLDASDCPGACSRCEAGSCIIECDDAGECDVPVVCPDGMPCVVRCAAAGSCGSGVTCGNKRCEVSCTGVGACDGDINCASACACITECSGTGACTGNTISCPGPAFCNEGGQCTDQPNQCDRC